MARTSNLADLPDDAIIMDEPTRPMTRSAQRASKKMWETFRHGTVAVGDFDALAVRYRNWRKIPKHTMMNKEKLEVVIGDFLGNANWLADSRTYSGNAKRRMKPFFLHALEEKAERDAKPEEEVIWEDMRNDNKRLISWVTMSGGAKAHDFWFATTKGQKDEAGNDTGYGHNWSMENNDKYYHQWMMENDEDYKTAYEAEQAAKEDA